jgi:hypothetical protein
VFFWLLGHFFARHVQDSTSEQDEGNLLADFEYLVWMAPDEPYYIAHKPAAASRQLWLRAMGIWLRDFVGALPENHLHLRYLAFAWRSYDSAHKDFGDGWRGFTANSESSLYFRQGKEARVKAHDHLERQHWIPYYSSTKSAGLEFTKDDVAIRVPHGPNLDALWAGLNRKDLPADRELAIRSYLVDA